MRKLSKTILLAVVLMAAGCEPQEPTPAAPALAQATAQYPDEPNSKLTPGDVRTTDLNEILNVKTSTVRNVPESEKAAVWASYAKAYPGVFGDRSRWKDVEFDHVISLTLGGSNSPKNLWPEHYSQPWGAHQKDALEDHLRALLAHGVISVPEAQHAIATDWIAAYKKYMSVSATKQ